MSDTQKVVTWFLMIFNILFVLLGGGILAAGVALMVRENLIGELYDEVKSPLASIVVEGVDQSLTSILNTVAIIAIASGSFVVLLGLIGCIGACLKSKTALIIYSLLVFLTLCAEVAIVVLTFLMKDEVENKLKAKMNETLYEGYTNDPENSKDVAWNAFFIKFECCGVDNYMDVKNAKNYRQNSLDYEVPPYCCKEVEFDFPNVKAPANDSNYECARTPTKENSNYMTGCFGTLKDVIFSYQTVFIVVGCVGFAVELFCIIAAACLCRQFGGDKMV